MMDKIKKIKLKVEFCPTHNMLADFFMKPLDGTQFNKKPLMMHLVSYVDC